MYPYNNQLNIERINNQIKDLENMKNQYQNVMPSNLTQNFQLYPPNNSLLRYVNNIDEVKKEYVVGDTAFFSKDLSFMWLKNTKGEVRAFELTEIVEKDEKDILIESLKYQIQELKKEMNESAKPDFNNFNESVKTEKPSNIQSRRSSYTKQK